MNPFLESTVARPQPVPPQVGARGQVGRHPGWRQVAGSMALATGMALAPAASAALANGPPPAAVINVNIATPAELETIRGVGPATAQRIVQERERAGPFISFQDFAERIRGIGPKRAAAMRAAGVGVSSSPPPPARP